VVVAPKISLLVPELLDLPWTELVRAQSTAARTLVSRIGFALLNRSHSCHKVVFRFNHRTASVGSVARSIHVTGIDGPGPHDWRQLRQEVGVKPGLELFLRRPDDETIGITIRLHKGTDVCLQDSSLWSTLAANPEEQRVAINCGHRADLRVGEEVLSDLLKVVSSMIKQKVRDTN
jgi:hypothetical protein